MTRKLFNTAIALSFTTSLLNANPSEIDKELGELFGTTQEKIVTSAESENDFLVEENTPEATNEPDSIINHNTPIATAAVVEANASPAPLEPTPERTENLLLAIKDNSISYTLPSTLEDVVIELLSLDGSVLKTTNHSKNEAAGSFDTSILNEGYYIVRVTDSIQKNIRIARAVAIKH